MGSVPVQAAVVHLNERHFYFVLPLTSDQQPLRVRLDIWEVYDPVLCKTASDLTGAGFRRLLTLSQYSLALCRASSSENFYSKPC